GGKNSDYCYLSQPERRCRMHHRGGGRGPTAGPHFADCRRRKISADRFLDDRALQTRRYVADSARRRDSSEGYCRSAVLKAGFTVSRFQGGSERQSEDCNFETLKPVYGRRLQSI